MAYYICDSCDKWFEDAQGKSEITDKTSVIKPAAGHTLSDWKAAELAVQTVKQYKEKRKSKIKVKLFVRQFRKTGLTDRFDWSFRKF